MSAAEYAAASATYQLTQLRKQVDALNRRIDQIEARMVPMDTNETLPQQERKSPSCECVDVNIVV